MDDNYMKNIASIFTKELKHYGYETYIVYCDSRVETQLQQIQNFITAKPTLIVVHCAGNSEIYEDTFREAQKTGCKVMVLGNTTYVKNCDMQSKSFHVLRGLRVCELIKEFLDKEYPDSGNGSVDMLLLEMINKTDYAEICAGYQMIGEKYLRYFDPSQAYFLRFDLQDTIYYIDESGRTIPVEEPSGGLILDRKGYAQLNPFYDKRITIHYANNRNINSNLGGQSAVDAFMSSPKGADLRIIASFSGDAAIGAAERLKYYNDIGSIDVGAGKLAVFGADDTEINRSLVLKSLNNESLLRGYVSITIIETKIHDMLNLLLNGKGNYYVSSESYKSVITKADGSYDVVMEAVIDNFIDDFDIFFTYDRQ